MSYAKPSIPTIDTPHGLDVVIQSLQQSLASLPWLEKSFGRAWHFNGVPKAYSGKGEYINVLPNDNLVSQSFIIADREEETVDYSVPAFTIDFQRRLNIFFWFNLKEIDANKDYIFTEELKGQVQKILKRNRYVKSINSYDDQNIFQEYKLKDDAKYMMYPFAGFQFNITVAYYEEC
jgi:hypothetical protein